MSLAEAVNLSQEQVSKTAVGDSDRVLGSGLVTPSHWKELEIRYKAMLVEEIPGEKAVDAPDI